MTSGPWPRLHRASAISPCWTLPVATGRLLLAFNVDFGELVFSRGAAAPTAILYFRLHPIVDAAATREPRRILGGHLLEPPTDLTGRLGDFCYMYFY